jgi:hypothetical protein
MRASRRPGWGDGLTAAFIKAYKEGRLLKISELNRGMMRPQFPEQVVFSYYQAALFCEWIEQKFGFDRIRQSLGLFSENRPAEEVFRTTLGWDSARLEEDTPASWMTACVQSPAISNSKSSRMKIIRPSTRKI